MTHFINSKPFIFGNENLRDPQKFAYSNLVEYYTNEYEERQTIIVMPTGTGKTGLMAIAPYGISKGKVLIVTPQTVVRNTVMEEINPLNPRNFYLFTKVFELQSKLPVVIDYDKTISDQTIQKADVVVLNIHKLQERLEGSLLNKVPKDFFDMIIIDEAHHSEARTWKSMVDYFENAKVVKVTGTPFRSDGLEIEGVELYRYSLGTAMAHGYVKSLERFTYLPDKMEFTMKDDDKIYSLEEIRMLKDDEWISRSVALSLESNKSIVDKSIERLKEKRRLTKNNPHKIVAVACSIEHAEQIHSLYSSAGLRSVIVHSKIQDKKDLEQRFKDIETHQVDVVVNVALLGEGYDHRFLSIAAIFRPYRSNLPYQQFVGRVLRSVSLKDGYPVSIEDNIAEVIHHQELNLDLLWADYKRELRKSKAIKDIKNEIRREKTIKPTASLEELDFGITQESEELLVSTDVFLDTQLLRLREEKLKENEERMQMLMNQFNVTREIAEVLSREIELSQNKESKKLLRPDLYEKDLRKQLASRIVEELVPNILEDYELDAKGMELKDIKSEFIAKVNLKPYDDGDNNGATLAKYFNVTLMRYISKPRADWSTDDYDRAIFHLKQLEDYVRSSLESHLKGDQEEN